MKLQSVPVLESKACIRFFRKRAKKGNVFENFGKNVKYSQIFTFLPKFSKKGNVFENFGKNVKI